MSWNWKDAPGASPAPRRRALARKVAISFLTGVLCVGVAWAGTGLMPASSTAPGVSSTTSTDASKSLPKGATAPLGESAVSSAAATQGLDLSSGQIMAGAAKISLYPRPDDYKAYGFPNARWEHDQAKCETFTPSNSALIGAQHVADFRVRWPENPDCLYMGGYGIGPMNSITSWDNDYGLWTRAVAMQDAQGDTLVLVLIDAIYWEAHLNSLCPSNPCGFLDLAKQLSDETGLPAKSFMFASTHSHTSMDFIGGWGAVPDWYMQQATDSLKQVVRDALASMQPAVVEDGEAIVRDRNGERRDFYYSAEDDNMSWLRIVDADGQPGPNPCTAAPAPSPSPSSTAAKGPKPQPGPGPTPICTPPAPGPAIATIAAFPAHPVTEDASGGQADADFPAVFAKTVEDAYGGIGMFLQTGLGNESPRGNKIQMGTGLASHIPPVGDGTQLTDTDLRVAQAHWDQPVTNIPLGSLGVTGFFDRTMNQLPASVDVGKGPENKKCKSASPISVDTSVSAAKLGNLWITGGPGELFSNLSNTIEERNPNGVTFALGLVNDGLGYIMQSFETDDVGRQGTGFVGSAGPVGLAEYEDAYSIDRCFGDATLEKTINLLGSI